MSPEQNAALQRAIASFNSKENKEAYFELYDPRCVIQGLTPPEFPPNLESAKQFYHMLWAAFPDGRLDIDDMVSEGDKVTARFSFQGTHQGEFMGIPPTGKQVLMTGMTFLRFAGNKVLERWNVADQMGLLQQLGAIPAPTAAT